MPSRSVIGRRPAITTGARLTHVSNNQARSAVLRAGVHSCHPMLEIVRARGSRQKIRDDESFPGPHDRSRMGAGTGKSGSDIDLHPTGSSSKSTGPVTAALPAPCMEGPRSRPSGEACVDRAGARRGDGAAPRPG